MTNHPNRSKRITIVYFGRDGGWWKVMWQGRCLQDFRDRKDAEKYKAELGGPGVAMT